MVELNDPSIGGTPGVFLLQAKALVGGDLKEVTLIPGVQPTPVPAFTSNHLSMTNRAVDTHYYGVMGIEKDNSDSSTLNGYIFTGRHQQVLLLTRIWQDLRQLPAMLIPILQHSSAEPSSTMLHHCTRTLLITRFFCESSSDTITVIFPAVGMNDLTSGQIMVYPNPARKL